MSPGVRFATIAQADFSGGLNLIAAPSQLADNETADALNVTIDQRGGIVKRLGWSNVGSALAGTPQQLFWYDARGLLMVQVGTTVYSTIDNGSNWVSRKVYSTSAKAAFAVFNSKLVAIHPVDGFSTFDGTTWTDVAAGPKGSTIAVWQNKVWTNDSVAPVKVHFSNAGDATTWVDSVDIREGSDDPVTALGAGQGMDVSGRGGLLVFKKRMIHRINSSTTGAYTTIFTDGGATNHNAVVSALGITAAMSDRGIVVLNSNDQATIASRKIDPLFRSTQINFAQTSLFAAGFHRDRLYFSFPWGTSQTTNNRTLEYVPAVDAFVLHDFGAAAFTVYRSGGTEAFYGASPTTSRVRQHLATGSDGGTAIASHFQSKWYEPLSLGAARFRQAMIEARGAFTLTTLLDYDSSGTDFDVDLTGATSLWGTFIWGNDDWGSTNFEADTRINEMGVGRAIAFRIEESSTTSVSAPNLLSDGASETVGGWAFYGFRLDFVPLGLS